MFRGHAGSPSSGYTYEISLCFLPLHWEEDCAVQSCLQHSPAPVSNSSIDQSSVEKLYAPWQVLAALSNQMHHMTAKSYTGKKECTNQFFWFKSTNMCLIPMEKACYDVRVF